MHMRISKRARGFGLALTLVLTGCPKPKTASNIFGEFGDVLPTATPEQMQIFERGKEVAQHRFMPSEGLGPTFNVTSCTACHEKPVTGGGGGRYRNFLLVGQTDSAGGYTPLGVNGVLDQYSVAAGRNPTPDGANHLATRHPIAFFGAGLLAEIPSDKILENADPDDSNHDGIRGRANYVNGVVGRFGRKSQTASIEAFIRGPLFNHLGITTDPLPDSLRRQLPVPSGSGQQAMLMPWMKGLFISTAYAQVPAPADLAVTDDDGVPDPELSQDDLFALVSYVMLTAAPRPDAPTPRTQAGSKLFGNLGCTGCHIPALEAPRGLIPAYSDLLLHDMGPGLADGVPMAEASGSDFRTQPLWGISAEGPYLHDGRADTLDDAIRDHGGEAQHARDGYVALSADQQAQVVEFVESLGGHAQRSEGLVPPDAGVPDPGQYGGPAVALSATEADQFLRGRADFDRDQSYVTGLGPEFNGDSCRACHFDPVIGGAGPSSVDAVRQGIFDAQGNFSAPQMGTVAHLHGALDGRPAIDPAANYFERRQAPGVFGLGLVDRIPDATIAAREDPNDSNGDGIRGRASWLPDGRLGRFGWKADVPSLHEFLRDALSTEVGLSDPAESNFTFGQLSDADDVSDPEVATGELADLEFFLANLGPPPRTRTNPAQEDAGEQVFARIGCTGCHVPQLRTSDGQSVPLYSDLLLHDIAAPGSLGIAVNSAGIHDFRTAPLWGLAKTAPYLHDGSAETIAAAIDAHGGEASATRAAFDALSADDRAALLAFLGSL
jgi:CxxC motif-containing protein (DUF1111 family)